MRRRRAALGAAVALGASAALAGCASADPPAVAAIGLDVDGYVAVVMMCDQGRTVTHVELRPTTTGEPELSWLGRTVEPITFYGVTGDPPDNWVVDVEGGLVSGEEYELVAHDGDDLEVRGPVVTLDDLGALGLDELIAADGTVSSTDTFLDTACDG